MAEFTKRPKGQGILFHSPFVPGKSLVARFPLEKSETVILHYQDRSVVIKNISRKTDDTFAGIVVGFEPPAMKLGDLKIDDTVTFSENEIISATKKD
jgi:hypothetical protein